MSLNTILATTPLVSTNYILKATGTTIGNSLIWDNGTNVGIGNTNTSYTLDVSGTGRFTGALRTSSTFTSGDTIQLGLASTDGGFWTWGASNSYLVAATGKALNLNPNGVSGSTGLSIATTGAATFSSSVSAATTFLSNVRSNTIGPDNNVTNNYQGYGGYWALRTDTNNAFNIDTYNSGTPKNVLNISQAGNVGINGSNPTSKLHVFGIDATVGNLSDVWNYSIFKVIPRPNLSDATLMISNAGNTSTIGISAASSTTSAQPLSLNPFGGNVLIATTTDYGYKLALNGQPGCNGYTAWTNWSDSRLKENVTDLEVTNVLDKICAIRPVTYNYNELSGFDEETRARRISGFIAQELMEVFPDMVGTIKKGDNEYYDTNLSNLTLYLVKAIQEQNQTIQSLQEQINILAK